MKFSGSETAYFAYGRGYIRIADEDQVAIMKEVVAYFEHEKSGIMDFSQMNEGWKKTCKDVKNSSTKLRKTDADVQDAVLSWIQEEKDMMLKLSSKLGVLVTSKHSKYKNNIQERINHDVEVLCKDKKISSYLKIMNIISDIKINLNLLSNNVDMSVIVKTDPNNSTRAKFSDIIRQIKKCKSYNENEFNKVCDHLMIQAIVKGNSLNHSVSCNDLNENSYKLIDKDKEVSEFRVILNKRLPLERSKVFIKSIEGMLFDFYAHIVVHLKNPQIKAPKPKEKETIHKITVGENN